MINFIIRRLGVSLISLFIGTFIVFSIIQLPPGDYVDFVIGKMTASSGEGEQVGKIARQLREYYGLDKPFLVRYFQWVGGLLRGNLGFSLLYRRPVVEVIASELFWTIVVVGASFAFSWFFGIAIGIYSAVKQYSIGDHIFTLFGFMGISIPNFFLAMLLIYLMIQLRTGVNLGLFSSRFVDAPWSWAKFIDLLKHLWMPVVAVGTARLAGVIRIMRGNLLDVLGQPYVNTARSKGLREFYVIVKHAARNAINPLISLAGMQASRLLSGMVVTAVVLNLPIIGPTFLSALNSQDMFLAGAYLLVSIVLLLLGNLVADLMLAWSDPRIRYD